MLQHSFRAMGCEMTALLDPTKRRAGEGAALIAQVPHWFAAWERRLSRFQPQSELSRLNRRGGRRARVSPTLWRALRTALRAARASGGLVVPVLLEQIERAGYDRSFELGLDVEDAPRPSAHAPRGRRGEWRRIACDRRGRRVRLPRGAMLDLGGTAKGWAADVAASRLGQCGPALIDAGGAIAMSAPPAGQSTWPVGVADPRRPGALLAVLNVPRGGVATSGRDYRRWRRGGAWQHHILDPRTGRPAETDVIAATAVAPTARRADVAAKVALILGSRDGTAWLDERPGLAGLLVLDGGEVRLSRGMRRYVEEGI
jgi:thiamine biosynthesis lipoprotein